MTDKEKAKAYDEALDRAKYYQKKNGSAVISAIFPELKENEDERIRKELIEYVKDQQSSFISAPDCRDKYEEEENNKYNAWIAWLESLRPQNRWKPSDKQMNALDSTLQYSQVSHNSYEHLNSLYNDLKKLTE